MIVSCNLYPKDRVSSYGVFFLPPVSPKKRCQGISLRFTLTGLDILDLLSCLLPQEHIG